MKGVLVALATLIYFAFVILLVLGNMLGDCFPGMGHSCPTDHERNVRILTILIGGVALYFVAFFGIDAIIRRRRS